MTKESLKDYFSKLKLLITSLTAETQTNRLLSIYHFNETIFHDRSGSQQFDHIRYVDRGVNNERSRNNPILKMIMSVYLSKEDWLDRYGLSITDTMKLDFHTFNIMRDRLKKYNKTVNEANDAVANSLPKI